MKAAPRLFLDASVLIAAAGSRTGASTLVLDVCRHGQAKAVSSRLVLLEADAPVLAAAVKGGVEVLLTLDRRHFLSPTVLEAGLPFPIMIPGDFLRRWVER